MKRSKWVRIGEEIGAWIIISLILLFGFWVFGVIG